MSYTQTLGISADLGNGNNNQQLSTLRSPDLPPTLSPVAWVLHMEQDQLPASSFVSHEDREKPFRRYLQDRISARDRDLYGEELSELLALIKYVWGDESVSASLQHRHSSHDLTGTTVNSSFTKVLQSLLGSTRRW